MDLQSAIALAHRDRDAYPINPLKEPPPTPAEALEIIRGSLKHCGFNWLTGQAARDFLIQHIDNSTPQPLNQ